MSSAHVKYAGFGSAEPFFTASVGVTLGQTPIFTIAELNA